MKRPLTAAVTLLFGALALPAQEPPSMNYQTLAKMQLEDLDRTVKFSERQRTEARKILETSLREFLELQKKLMRLQPEAQDKIRALLDESQRRALDASRPRLRGPEEMSPKARPPAGDFPSAGDFPPPPPLDAFSGPAPPDGPVPRNRGKSGTRRAPPASPKKDAGQTPAGSVTK